MEIFVFDNRSILPPFFDDFLSINGPFSKVNLITNFTPSPEDGGYSGVNFINLSRLGKFHHVSGLFDDVYVHRSANSKQFEKLCFLRWFAYDLATSHLNDLDYLCVLDSDQALFVSPAEVLAACTALSNTTVPELITWLPPNSRSPVIEAGPALTIMSKRCLRAFCLYLLQDFYSPSNVARLNSFYYQSLASAYGASVSDMTALGHFAFLESYAYFNLRDFYLNSDEFFCCENVLYYLTTHYVSQVNPLLADGVFKRSANGLTLATGALSLRVIGLHFQGSAKPLMALFSPETASIPVDSLDAHMLLNSQSDAIPSPSYGFFLHGIRSRVRSVLMKFI